MKRKTLSVPFDLFGEGKYCYTFREWCDEDRTLSLNDGAMWIFLNTKGTNDSEVSRELVDFLHYIESADAKIAEGSGSERIQKIHTCVSRIKKSEIAGVKYMQRWEQEMLWREEGREEGILSALMKSVQNLMQRLELTADEAMEMLEVPVELKERIGREIGTEKIEKQ